MFKRLATFIANRCCDSFCIVAVGLALAAGIVEQVAAQDEQQQMLMNARGPFGRADAAQLGLSAWANAPAAEVRVWVWHRGDRDDYLLRLWQSGDRTEGELLALSKDDSGIHSRTSSKARDWSAILRDLQEHAIWTIPAPTYVTACVADTNLIIESYRDGQYRQVEYSGVRHYPGDPQSIYDYVFALAAGDPQIASVANTRQFGCG